jgi:N utilization substance protein A
LGESKPVKNEFALAFNEVLEDKKLPKEVVLEAIEAAMVSAYRRAVNASNAQIVEAKVDAETGKVLIFAEKEVVEAVQDTRTEVSLEDAIAVDENAEISSMVIVESTPKNFGRVAAQTARQVIQQKIREAERDAQHEYFSKQLGEIVSGVVQAVSGQAVTLGLDMKAEGIMPRNQQIPGERYRLHDRLRALLLEVKSTPRGPQLILTRAHRNFLRRLLENEVPEIYHGLVEIRSIAREPGQRSKVAVAALQAGVDPVGACVGIRGVRIQTIVRELNDEKIDVIEWNPDQAAYIAKALSPARVTGVYLNEYIRGTKTATVVVPEDQLSLAIGRNGQNARLAAKLTSWRIDIKSLPEAAADTIYKLQTDLEYVEIAKVEAPNIDLAEAILAKKDQGRLVTPEEYSQLGKLVDRVEHSISTQREETQREETQLREAALATTPKEAFELPLDVLGFAARLHNILIEAGYNTVGDLMLQMKMDSDKILDLIGVGPKSIDSIETAFDELVIEIPEEKQEIEEPSVIAEPGAEVTEPAEIAEPAGDVDGLEELQPVIEEEITPETLEPAESVIAEAVELSEEGAELATETEISAPVPEMGEAEEEPAEIPAAEPAIAEVSELEEEPSSLEEIFTFKPEEFGVISPTDEDEEIETLEEAREKKKKKKKYIEMEYDPDQDVVIVKRKRKRGTAEWDEEWDY